MTLVGSPRVIFLDEPTTGLDPRSRRTMWDAIRALAAGGTTIFLTTQYLDEADELADRIAVLDRGRIVARGTAEELKARLGGATLRLRFADVDSLREAAWLFAAARVDERLRTLELPTDGSTEDVQRTLVRLVAADVASSEISIERPSLDDVFLHLTGGTAGRNLDHADLQEAV
jgi:ABC-2 type transport system ATP-binding protein